MGLCVFIFQASRGIPQWQSKASRFFNPIFLHWALETARKYLEELLTNGRIELPNIRVAYSFTTTPTSATGAVFSSEEDNFIFALAQVMRAQLGNLRRCANPACKRIFRVKRGDQIYHIGGCGGLFRMRKSRGTPPERYGVRGRPSTKEMMRSTKLKKEHRNGTERGQDRGITQRKDRKGWWVRLYVNGRERWFSCDTKSQAKALYGRLKADIREGTFFPEKFAPRKDITLRAWILRCLEGSTNLNIENERRYGRRWSLLLGKRMLVDISREDCRQVQAKMRAKLKPRPANAPKEFQQKRRWSDATINRHFAFLRHVLMLAVKDSKLTQNPVSGLKFFPEVKRTRFLSEDELARLRGVMQRVTGSWSPLRLRRV